MTTVDISLKTSFTDQQITKIVESVKKRCSELKTAENNGDHEFQQVLRHTFRVEYGYIELIMPHCSDSQKEQLQWVLDNIWP